MPTKRNRKRRAKYGHVSWYAMRGAVPASIAVHSFILASRRARKARRFAS
jgi:hypothetical protein